MRLIDADALVVKRGNWYVEEGTEEGFVGTLKALLDEEPTIEPEPQWTPVSEGLPEVGRSVLMSVGGIYATEGCLRDDGDWTQFRWRADLHEGVVDAWKPLPKPWKGEQPCS